MLHDQISIDADHSGMVKFSSDHDPNYEIVFERLEECVQNGRDVRGSMECL
jgi:hypothetical protein